MTEKTVRFTENEIDLLTAILATHRRDVLNGEISLIIDTPDERVESVDIMISKIGDAW